MLMLMLMRLNRDDCHRDKSGMLSLFSPLLSFRTSETDLWRLIEMKLYVGKMSRLYQVVLSKFAVNL